MGTVLIHAGMPKTGSTSIQSWLRAHLADLRAEHGITVVREVGDLLDRPIRFGAAEPSSLAVGGNGYLLHYEAWLAAGADRAPLERLTAELVDSLDELATTEGTVLLSAEGFSTMFVRCELPFLHGLETLAARHTVRVACYVRPQHTALEARWRQWGFRNRAVTPQAWVRAQADQLRYLEMVECADRHAPAASFEMRPFRSDLLTGGDVVVDFATALCGVDAPAETRGSRDNLGLPLDVAILLRSAPQGLVDALDFAGSGAVESGARQARLAELARSWAIPESAAALRSREVLHAYAYQEFEGANRALGARLGWPGGLIDPPAADPGSPGGSLAELDREWAPPPSAAVPYLLAALKDLLAPPPPP